MPQSNINRVVSDTLDVQAQSSATGTRLKNVLGTLNLRAIANAAETAWAGLTAKNIALQGANATNNLTLTVPTLSASYTMTLPAAAPTLNSALTVNASGTATFAPQLHAVCQGRLTGVTGAPAADTASTGSTTLYFTPYLGNLIGTYSGSVWTIQTFAEQSRSVSGLTTSTVYDIFISDSTLALSAVAWTNATTRATSIVLQDGVYVLSGTTTKRYLGTIYTQKPGANVVVIDYSGAISGTAPSRCIWNMYNRLNRGVFFSDSTASWSGVGGAWRQANGNSADQMNVVCGVVTGAFVSAIQIFVSYFVQNTSTTTAYIVGGAVGLDSITTPNVNMMSEAGTVAANSYLAKTAILTDAVPTGYHYYSLMEYAGNNAVTFYGINRGGFCGTVEC
jgi:hypothetical protein